MAIPGVSSSSHLLYRWWEGGQLFVNYTARMTKDFYRSWPLAQTAVGRSFSAAAEVVEHFTDLRTKPEWGIDHTMINGKRFNVSINVVLEKPFCNLLHFAKQGLKKRQPKLLIIAPMSGHYATLLRGTVEGFLPEHDVYITDWKNARMVPRAAGAFDFHTYIDYEIEFMDALNRAGDLHVKAVCQPCPATLAAVAVMAARHDPARPVPRSVIFTGGPVYTRANPTKVTSYAEKHSLGDMEQMAIHEVPFYYPGGGRKVYPGALQLASFLGMNPDEHGKKMLGQFGNLTRGDKEPADAHRRFYDEYLAVCDLTAEFYLQTVHYVFHEQSIARGIFRHHGERVDLSAITDTAFMVTEGENDDISAPGQALAALHLATGLSDDKKCSFLIPSVGHYGVFNGSVFRKTVLPREAEFIAAVDATGRVPGANDVAVAPVVAGRTRARRPRAA